MKKFSVFDINNNLTLGEIQPTVNNDQPEKDSHAPKSKVRRRSKKAKNTNDTTRVLLLMN